MELSDVRRVSLGDPWDISIPTLRPAPGPYARGFEDQMIKGPVKGLDGLKRLTSEALFQGNHFERFPNPIH